jgi:phytoene dehydrogenase-like protein
VKIKSDLLIVHNILFSGDYKREFEIMFKDKNICDDPTIYIYISSKFSKDDAPEGYENWFVMVNAPYNTNQNWDEILTGLKTNILNKIKSFLEIDISSLIVFEKILTPADIETETLSNKGSIYGISSNTKMAAFMRQRNKSKEYKGLYFCGGSVHPGGGVPLVILSGKIAAELIIRKEL